MSLPGIVDVPAAVKPTRRELIIAVAGTVVRLILGFVLIAFALTLVPDTPDGRMLAPIGVALLGAVVYLVISRRQLKRITHSRFPTLMAAEALVLLAALFLAVFAMIYVAISLFDAKAFTEPLDAFTSYYFALTVLATVGFGDITPVTTVARAVTMVQMALDLVFIAVLIRVVSTAARKGLAHRGVTTEDSTAS
ncbi:MAG: potassium channel family protein [Candidatus Nanopelagicales bacterium]|nr:potassium channel family protein [Candidatus Nanopelagicales bacterium]MCF8536558.1 potassium channel family protein [Candidatus Nanopelagicales bacterium]MCF8541842.1 potassium channel family protein [Candidatus Nanopelagicales bacterium]MCF8556366.1 potassium channel family protein [Candidatus Nanopelagicales bacterium]